MTNNIIDTKPIIKKFNKQAFDLAEEKYIKMIDRIKDKLYYYEYKPIEMDTILSKGRYTISTIKHNENVVGIMPEIYSVNYECYYEDLEKEEMLEIVSTKLAEYRFNNILKLLDSNKKLVLVEYSTFCSPQSAQTGLLSEIYQIVYFVSGIYILE